MMLATSSGSGTRPRRFAMDRPRSPPCMLTSPAACVNVVLIMVPAFWEEMFSPRLGFSLNVAR